MQELSHHHHDENSRIVEINARDIAPVELLEHLRKSEDLIYKTVLYFFSSKRFSANAPFKGFLVHGPVGTGKTELVKQVARKVGEHLKDDDVRLVPVDSSVVASPKWGESEQVFESLFSMVKGLDHERKKKIILLFDDLESLLLARGMSAAREWHYSLNAVFFHLVDNMNPFESIVIATTNRADLMDSAITTRLYGVQISNVPKTELLKYTDNMLDSMLGPNPKKHLILKDVESRLENLQTPTIRDCRQMAIISCIENNVLTV